MQNVKTFFSFSESYAILEPQLEIANTTHEQK